MRSDDFFTIDDLPLLQREADLLREEGDGSGLRQLHEVLHALTGEVAPERFRGPEGGLPLESLPTASLLAFDASATLGKDFNLLDPFTRECLSRAAKLRNQLGEAPENGRGIGLYIVLGFEHEVRVRTEPAFLSRWPGGVGERRPNLFELWRFFHERRVVSGRMAAVIDLRNRLVHPPSASGGHLFTVHHFNRLLNQTGLARHDGKGAFRELARLRLRS